MPANRGSAVRLVEEHVCRENATEKPVAVVKNGAHALLERLEGALEAGEIDEAGWYAGVASVITPAYLDGDNPRAQSGFSGGDARWEQARGLIADAIGGDGTFLDVGCASGYLMESILPWARRRGYAVEPFGLDIAPELADLARSRLPQWSDRIWVGNGLTWVPLMRFDYVRTGLEYVPHRRRKDLIEHLFRHAVAPGGRLIIGTTNEEKAHVEHWIEDEVADWGFAIAGHTERPHRDERIVYRVFWIDCVQR
jgi:SAM-dependent methyltransferase